MKITIDSGVTVYTAYQKAIKVAKEFHQEVQFNFNGIFLKVQPGSHEYDIAENYYLKAKIRRLELGYKS